MKYEFKTAQGRVCCSNNDVRLLCPSCKAKAGVTAPSLTPLQQEQLTHLRALERQNELRKRLGPLAKTLPDTVPPPPDMHALIRAARGVTTQEDSGLATAANTNGVPAPPDLHAAIRAARGVRRTA